MAACMNCGEEAGRNVHGILKDYCSSKCARKDMSSMSKGAHVYDMRARAKVMLNAKYKKCAESIQILKEEYHMIRWESEGIKII